MAGAGGAAARSPEHLGSLRNPRMAMTQRDQITWTSFVSTCPPLCALEFSLSLQPAGNEVAIMKKVDHSNLASVHEVIDVTSDDALLSESSPDTLLYAPMLTILDPLQSVCSRSPLAP